MSTSRVLRDAMDVDNFFDSLEHQFEDRLRESLTAIAVGVDGADADDIDRFVAEQRAAFARDCEKAREQIARALATVRRGGVVTH
jgi:hypothetical protein